MNEATWSIADLAAKCTGNKSSECNSYRRQLSIATVLAGKDKGSAEEEKKNREEFIEKQNKKIKEVEHSVFSRAIKDAKI